MSTYVIKISIRVVVKILVITMKSNTDHCIWVWVTQYLCLLLKSLLNFVIKILVITNLGITRNRKV
jgi:hypothetical protein